MRRPTGGRGVLHEHELTYSVIVTESYPNMPATVTEAYRVISEGFMLGFQKLGLDAYFSIPDTDEKRQDLKNQNLAFVLIRQVGMNLVVEGKKVAGSAQTRQKGVILQHGAILLDLDEDKLIQTFKFASEAVRDRVRKGLSEKAVAINKIISKPVTMEECKTAFKKGFADALEIELVEYNLTERTRRNMYNN